MEHALTAAVGILSTTLILIALIHWPSMAGFWRWVEFEGRVRAEAQELMDRARAVRKGETANV